MTTAPVAVWWRTAIACRCPRCGVGKLFNGVLKVRPICAYCGLDLGAHDSGDGPASLVILLLGAIVVGLAFWVEFRFNPPLWVHILLWPLVITPLALLLMRPLKAGLIAQQYHHRASEMGL